MGPGKTKEVEVNMILPKKYVMRRISMALTPTSFRHMTFALESLSLDKPPLPLGRTNSDLLPSTLTSAFGARSLFC